MVLMTHSSSRLQQCKKWLLFTGRHTIKKHNRRPLPFQVLFFLLISHVLAGALLSDQGEPSPELKEALTGFLSESPDEQKKGADILQRLVEQGDIEAMHWLAVCYEGGIGVDVDKPKAFQLQRKAAEGGIPAAMDFVGVYYEFGVGTRKNPREAVKWYEKSISEGKTPSAYCNLARCYSNGKGVPQNHVKAAEYLTTAAQADHAGAMFSLGVMYCQGTGVDKDFKKGIGWIEKGANKGDNAAMNEIAVCYMNGVGKKKNPRTAVNWFRRSASAGNSSAMHNLGRCYANGQGVTRNLKQAREWLQKSVDAGNESARSDLYLVNHPEEIEKQKMLMAVQLFGMLLSEGQQSDDGAEMCIACGGSGQISGGLPNGGIARIPCRSCDGSGRTRRN